jgi:hypothetical protein
MAALSPLVERSMAKLRLDFTTLSEVEGPSTIRLVLATAVSIGLSLGADAALVAIGTRVFPSTRGYGHFQFQDYAKLTVIGIVIAAAAWPAVTRVSSAACWLFFRLAIAVTVVLLLPDIYILHQGQPAKAVAILMLMHLAIALITYNALVHLAPAKRRREPAD